MSEAREVRSWWRKIVAGTLALIALALASTCTINSLRWIGTTFPGFFVMANRVIASVSLPHWPAANDDVFQSEVVAVNGRPAASSRDIYSTAKQSRPGTSIDYTLERDGHIRKFTARTLTFTSRDYLLIFVPYLVSGLALALIGIVVWYSKPAPASLALLIGGISGGVFAITGADLYSPHWFFRVHILGEAFFPASLLVHLALVFPVDRVRDHRRLILSLPYVIAGAMGAAYEIFLYRPAAYSLIHNLCMVYAGFGGAALLAAVAWDYWTTASQLIRQRIRIILLGFLCGFAFPGALMFYSGVTGGQASVNYAGFTVVLFPLSIGYAIVKHDLFEIDAMVKRSVYYIAITATLGLGYLGFLSLTDFALHSTEFSHSPLFPLSFTLAVVIFINPLKDSVQRAVDRVFFRLRYNPKEMLEITSAALASTLQLGDIVSFVWNTICGTMGILSGRVFVLAADERQYTPIYPDHGGESPRFSADHPLVDFVRRRRGSVLSRYDLEDDGDSPAGQDTAREALDLLHAQLIVPLILKGDLIGFLALGQRESGAFFSVDDIGFLTALANQGAVSIANAIAYREIQNLNAALEKRVAERTAELSQSNADLHASVRQVEQAYRDLQRSQEELSRAEKMATLGRLAAGIAHEMNTPLGASMTSLKLLQDLVDEYTSSSSDPQVTPDDHREIAAEMNKLVGSTRDWLRKAAGHIRSLKLHTRALQSAEPATFSVLDTIEDVGLLLSHRLRGAQSTLTVTCNANDATLYGDAGKLGQALTNLVSNAIDANREAGNPGAEVAIEVVAEESGMIIRVRDHGHGIAPEHSAKIFEEFFSTKAMGEGTGLGLPIARDIVSNFFGGTVAVESSSERGSVLVIYLPRRSKHSSPSPLHS